MNWKIKNSHSFWKNILLMTILIGCGVLAYTVVKMDSAPELPTKMIMPLIQAKSGEFTTRKLVSNFTEARELSEDFLLETEKGKLMSIERAFDHRLQVIDLELHKLSMVEDAGLEILVANLLRLKGDFERDAKGTFRNHRKTLGLDG